MSAAEIKQILVLTGAGISAESGLSTFRGAGGIWENHRVEDVASPDAFRDDPALVHRFYNARRSNLLHNGIKPNQAHAALARLERQFKGQLTVVTQNVDNLHEIAGSQNVLHMHGELLRKICCACERSSPAVEDIHVSSVCDSCAAVGTLRPDIVWFGEMPKYMDEIYSLLEQCDVFAAIGTSGHVYPAAGFVNFANEHGASSIEINLEPSMQESRFQDCRYGPASLEVPAWVDSLLER